MPELTETDREILALERKWWAFRGAKERAIRDRLDMSATRFYRMGQTAPLDARRPPLILG